MSGKALPALGSKRPLELADNLCARPAGEVSAISCGQSGINRGSSVVRQ